MLEGRRLLAGLLVPMGVVASHALGHLAAGTDTRAWAHALGLLHGDLWKLAALGAASVLVVFLLDARRPEDRTAALPFAAVTAGQCAVYVAMELAQSSTHGASLPNALLAPALRWGVAIQLLIAVAAWLLVRVTKAVVRALRTPRVATAAPRPRTVGRAARTWRSICLSGASGRGPPLLVATS